MVAHFLCCRQLFVVVYSIPRQNHQRCDSFLPLTFKIKCTIRKMWTVFKCGCFKIDTRQWTIHSTAFYFMTRVASIEKDVAIQYALLWPAVHCSNLLTYRPTAPQPCINAYTLSTKGNCINGISHWQRSHFSEDATKMHLVHELNLRQFFFKWVCVNHVVVSFWVYA